MIDMLHLLCWKTTMGASHYGYQKQLKTLIRTIILVFISRREQPTAAQTAGYI